MDGFSKAAQMLLDQIKAYGNEIVIYQNHGNALYFATDGPLVELTNANAITNIGTIPTGGYVYRVSSDVRLLDYVQSKTLISSKLPYNGYETGVVIVAPDEDGNVQIEFRGAKGLRVGYENIRDLRIIGSLQFLPVSMK